MKKRLLLLLQIAVTAGILWWFFRDPEFRAMVVEVWKGADGRWLLAGFFFAGLETFLGVLRWRIFLSLLGISLPFWKSVQIYYVGLLCNTFLIGSVGGDAVKAVYLIARGCRKSDAILSVVMDRISGLGALILASAIFIPMRYDWLSQSQTVSMMIHFVYLYLLGVVVLLGATFYAAAMGKTDKVPQWVPGRPYVIEISASYFKFVSGWRQTLAAVVLSVLILCGYFAIYFCSGMAFGAPLQLWDWFAFMPSVDLITALPVSLGGTGVREGLFVIILGQLADVPQAKAVLISLAGYLIASSWGLLGGLMLPFVKNVFPKK